MVPGCALLAGLVILCTHPPLTGEPEPVLMKDAEIGVHGNDKIWEWTLKRFLSAYDDEEVGEGLLADIAIDLVTFYRENGFPFASVKMKQRRRKGRTRVSLRIREGPRVRVKEVRFEGLHSVPEEEMRDLISTRPAKILSSSYFVRADVEADARVIAQRVLREGRLQVRVEEEIELIQERTATIVTFKITEGKRVGIAEIRFTGNEALRSEELIQALSFNPGDPYSARGVEEQRWVILDVYADRGYPHCKIEPEPAEVDLERGEAVLTFRIGEGERSRVGEIRFEGHRVTSDSLLKSRLTFQSGDWFSREKLRATTDRLYRLGLFESVRTEVRRKAGGRVAVTFRIKERKAGLVRVGVGYGSFEGIRGTLGVSYSNLFGWAKRAEAETRVSGVGNRTALRYIDPSIFLSKWKGKTEVFYEDREDPNFDVLRFGGTASLTHPLVEKVTFSLGGRLERSQVSDLATGLVAPERTLDLRSVSFVLTRAGQDVPANPSRGTFLQAALESAGGRLGGEGDFDKIRTAGAVYVTAIPDWVVVALSARAGWIFPRDPDEGVPIQEQFFTGGEGTLRGFQEKEIIPLDSFGIPTGGGGDSLLVLNAEVRVRIIGNFWGAVFWDAGNVWEDPDGIDVDDLRHSPGLGVRYLTPIGPLRLDWAHKIDREEGERPWELHLSVGFAF